MRECVNAWMRECVNVLLWDCVNSQVGWRLDCVNVLLRYCVSGLVVVGGVVGWSFFVVVVIEPCRIGCATWLIGDDSFSPFALIFSPVFFSAFPWPFFYFCFTFRLPLFYFSFTFVLYLTYTWYLLVIYWPCTEPILSLLFYYFFSYFWFGGRVVCGLCSKFSSQFSCIFEIFNILLILNYVRSAEAYCCII